MSAASNLLRRRGLRALTSGLKHRQREFKYQACGSHHGLRDFGTSEHFTSPRFPRAHILDRKPRGASFAHRTFATDTDNAPIPPQASRFGTGVKVTAVAITVAALTWAATHYTLDVNPEQLPKYVPQPTKEEKQGASFESVAKESQAPQSPVVDHQSDVKDSELMPSTKIKPEESNVRSEVPEESNAMLQVIKGLPLNLPKVNEELERQNHGIVDSEFQIKEIEDVDSSPQTSLENDGSQGSQQSTEESSNADIGDDNSINIATHELKEGVEQSHPRNSTIEVSEDVLLPLPSAFSIDVVTDVKEEVGHHLHDTAADINLETARPDESSGQPDIPVDTSGQLFANTNIEDLDPDAFRKEMQETAKGEDLKEFSEKMLYNQTSDDKNEKEAISSADAVASANDVRNVVAETVEAVTGRAQVGLEANQDVTIKSLQPDISDVPDVLVIPGLLEAYSLADEKVKESEEPNGEEYGSDKSFTYAGAIEEAERRQAEADAQFREMLLRLDEEYQQELREARKQQELQAEYANKLKKDLSVEKVRWEQEARKQLQAAEERLRNELKRKDEEVKRELETLELITQARVNAAVASEKAMQLKDTKELQLQIEALHKAYNAQSEGARVSHTTHKLAMGAFAFKDAMTRGAPLEEEVALIKQAAGGYDELINIALQSLPEDALTKGTKTLLQLEREFSNLQGPLRQLSLIPDGQGGLLTLAVASVAAAMKVQEGSGREGVESVIAAVEESLANGELSQAANILEQGVKGSRAEGFISDWARNVRCRAIAEQTLTLVQAHAIATAAGLA